MLEKVATKFVIAYLLCYLGSVLLICLGFDGGWWKMNDAVISSTFQTDPSITSILNAGKQWGQLAAFDWITLNFCLFGGAVGAGFAAVKWKENVAVSVVIGFTAFLLSLNTGFRLDQAAKNAMEATAIMSAACFTIDSVKSQEDLINGTQNPMKTKSNQQAFFLLAYELGNAALVGDIGEAAAINQMRAFTDNLYKSTEHKPAA